MKSEILKLLMYVSKGGCYLLLVQVISFQLLLAGNTNGQSPEQIKITIHMTDATPVEVFDEIEKKTGFRFIHSRSVAKLDKRLTIAFEQESLELVLAHITEKTGLQF